ncbi:MAG: hypothetical protein ABW133_02415 [Polyangiaceae bacterium]
MFHRSSIAFAIALSSSFVGCLDATPISLESQDAGLSIDAGEMPEAGEGSDGGEQHPCRACVAADPTKGPGCGDKLEQCRTGAEKCIAIYECAFRKGCVTKLTHGESIACAIPCAGEVGVTDVNSQDIQLAIRLTECFHDKAQCASACEGAAIASH